MIIARAANTRAGGGAGRWIVGTVLVLGLAIGLVGEPAAQTKESVSIGYVSFDSVYNGLFVTNDRGYFDKYGLDAKLVFLESDPRAAQALVAGSIDMIFTSGVSAVRAIANGSDFVFLGAGLNTLTGSMVTRASITDPATQLKGGKWAVSSFGAESELAAKKALAHYGLRPGQDVTIVPIGNQALRFAALESGAVTATTLLPPILNKAMASKDYKVWVSMPEIVPAYLSVGWVVNRSKLQQRSNAFRQVLKAYAEGTAFYKSNKDASVPIIQKWFKLDTPVLAAAAWDYYAPLMSVDMKLTEKSFDIIMENVPEARQKGLKLSDLADVSIIESLEKEGFFRTLR